MPPVIMARDDPKYPVVFWRNPFLTAPDELYDRILAAAEWCQQTEYEFIKAAILDRLNDVEVLMTGWDEEEETTSPLEGGDHTTKI